jgi:hypothetical protein
VSIRFLADEDLRYAIVSGVLRRDSSISFPTVPEAGLAGAPDPQVIEFAARENRIVVSHDKRTMPGHFAAFLRSGRNHPGLLLAPKHKALAEVIETLIIIWADADPEQWRKRIHYLPSLSEHVLKPWLSA